VKTLSVTHVARHFSAVLDLIEHDREEIVLVRNRRHVARIVPRARRTARWTYSAISIARLTMTQSTPCQR